MANATYTYTIKPITVFGDKRVHEVKLVVSDYQADGIVFTAKVAGMAAIDAILGFAIKTIVAAGPVTIVWDSTNSIIHALQAANSKVTNGVAFSLDVTVMGS